MKTNVRISALMCVLVFILSSCGGSASQPGEAVPSSQILEDGLSEDNVESSYESNTLWDETPEADTFLPTESGNLTQSDAIPGNHQTISTDGESYFAIRNDNTLWGWGQNHNGQLGIGTKTDLNGPQQAEPVLVMEDVKAVSTGGRAGADHTLIVKTDGTLWACGSNDSGQLGNGMMGDGVYLTPIYVMDDVVSVCAGCSSFAVKSDHSLWAWGDNTWGQLGNSSTEPQSSPIKVMDNVVSVSSIQSCTFAIKTDGTLWAWGFNSSGDLGNGTTENTTIPVKIMDNVTIVSAGFRHSYAVKTDGTLWGWGGIWDNGIEYDEPIYLMDDVSAIAVEYLRSEGVFALKNDGTLWHCSNSFKTIYYTNSGEWRYWDGTEEPEDQVTGIVAIEGGNGDIGMIVKSDGTLYGGWNAQVLIMDDVKIP